MNDYETVERRSVHSEMPGMYRVQHGGINHRWIVNVLMCMAIRDNERLSDCTDEELFAYQSLRRQMMVEGRMWELRRFEAALAYQLAIQSGLVVNR